MRTGTKQSALLQLARKRQADTLLSYSRKYFHLRDFDCECDHVAPWTISASNVDADLMLIAQDWASEDFLRRLPEDDRRAQRELGQFPALPTNRNIKVLLQEHMKLAFCQTYATNAFVFVKPGKMDNRIPLGDLARSQLHVATDRDYQAEDGFVPGLGVLQCCPPRHRQRAFRSVG